MIVFTVQFTKSFSLAITYIQPLPVAIPRIVILFQAYMFMLPVPCHSRSVNSGTHLEPDFTDNLLASWIIINVYIFSAVMNTDIYND